VREILSSLFLMQTPMAGGRLRSSFYQGTLFFICRRLRVISKLAPCPAGGCSRGSAARALPPVFLRRHVLIAIAARHFIVRVNPAEWPANWSSINRHRFCRTRQIGGVTKQRRPQRFDPKRTAASQRGLRCGGHRDKKPGPVQASRPDAIVDSHADQNRSFPAVPPVAKPPSLKRRAF